MVSAVSPILSDASRVVERGNPYGRLAQAASTLALDLEQTASRCESSAERRRLQVLAAAAARIAGCLANVGTR